MSHTITMPDITMPDIDTLTEAVSYGRRGLNADRIVIAADAKT